ncbi:MAG TPA: AAA family ATPase, partial [Labilithrix sp.]|nr:AAA family ATPase [Labilithrix sp.]
LWQEWGGQQNTYWPRPELLEAIRRLPPLAALMQRPIAEVAASPPLSLALPADVAWIPTKATLEGTSSTSTTTLIPFVELLIALNAAGLVFPADIVANLLLALQVKRFVILTGISGTGKTRIGQTIARVLRHGPSDNAEVIAVRPDWTDHRGLLGHYNPLTQAYVATPFLRLLLRARDEHTRARAAGENPAPYFALLDEMNLARVEHYFADFLSALESGEALHLHDVAALEAGSGNGAAPVVPRRLFVPPNLFFIGTVNVDETTHFFSPKVLDRAFTIELDTVDLDGLASELDPTGDLGLSNWSGRLDPPAQPSREDWQWLAKHGEGELARHIKAIHALLARHHRHFGYRVAEEIARFIRLAVHQAAEPESAAGVALDLAILQKVLVKLNGTQADLEEPLRELLDYALAGDSTEPALHDPAFWKLDPAEGKVIPKDEASESVPLLPRSAAKLWRMRERLQRQGFTAWIE